MLEVLLTILRDHRTSSLEFRQATAKLATYLALQAANFIKKETVQVKTPVGEASGFLLNQRVTLVPILRSGLALLPSFMEFFPEAPIGFIGIKRHKITAKPDVYYTHFPPLNSEDLILVLEPMIATGGSSLAAIEKLVEQGAAESQIVLISVITAPEGIQPIYTQFPKVQVLSAHVDSALNDRQFIVPGLGDFGDRYFGTP
jgi:uracil phosphoribosyltransferase